MEELGALVLLDDHKISTLPNKVFLGLLLHYYLCQVILMTPSDLCSLSFSLYRAALVEGCSLFLEVETQTHLQSPGKENL